MKGNASYSYSYDGLAGTLDYMLVNQAAMDMMVDVNEWHINSDEPEFYDYNEEYKPASFLNELVYRASDHDPVIGTYLLEAEEEPVTGDWDGDGDVDRDDVTALMRAIFARQDIDMSFDLNNDGRVNARDIGAMRRMCTRRGCATDDATPSGRGRTLSSSVTTKAAAISSLINRNR